MRIHWRWSRKGLSHTDDETGKEQWTVVPDPDALLGIRVSRIEMGKE